MFQRSRPDVNNDNEVDRIDFTCARLDGRYTPVDGLFRINMYGRETVA